MLAPYRTMADCEKQMLNAAERLIMSGAERFVDHKGPCPKCRRTVHYVDGHDVIKIRGCSGCWWRWCRIMDLHMHARCVSCGARWVMMPADADRGAAAG